MKLTYIVGTVCILSLIIFISVYVSSSLSSSLRLVPPIFIKGSIVTHKAVVLDNIIKSSAGQPMYLKVKKEGGILSGSEIKIIYHSNNAPCVKNGMQIKAGQKIEFHGIAVADDTISLCGSEDYYVTLLEQYQNSAIEDVIRLAKESESVGEARKNFDLDLTLKAKANFSADKDSWSLEIAEGVSAKEFCNALKIKRCYLVSGDVHQESWSIEVWTEDLKDDHDPRIATEQPIIRKWTLDTRGERPTGDLPKLAAGASPAYDLNKYDTQIKFLTFKISNPAKH